MAELLLELLCEEIPARMQARGAEDLKRLVTKALDEAQLPYEEARAFVTPRRLALVVDGLPRRQPDVREERRGPRANAPDKAIAGFLKSVGLSRDEVEVRDTDKGTFLFAVIEKKGRPTAEVLAEVLPQAVAAQPWPKSMRWGSWPERWVRPIHGVVCLFDGEEVALTVGRVDAGRATRGHRFHAPKPFKVKDFADYKNKLREAYVVLDAAERREMILERAEALVGEEGLVLERDEALLAENAGLVEWPVVLMGRIDEDFMDLPPEVLATVMSHHQKYFSVREESGAPAPRFVLVSNLEAADGGAAIIAGNERVLRARLADARFYWDQDRKQSLASRVPRLEQIVFHSKLGTLDDKVERMRALAGEIAGHVPGADADQARSAARLAKADLVTGMVGELPELQGIMGRYYALEDGETAAVAEAIAEHYAPQGPSDRCPTAPVSIAVALADKIDTLVGFFAIGETPTGTKDPYALRRAALGTLRLILENEVRLPLREVIETAVRLYRDGVAGERVDLDPETLLDFFAERLKVHLRGQGVRHDLISAVFALGGEDDVVRLLARVHALASFLDSDDGEHLLTAFKRANNIVRIEEKNDKRHYEGDDLQTVLLVDDREKDLSAGLDVVKDQVTDALRDENFTAACQAFAKLRGPVDKFFDDVMVNVDDKGLRENRLRLLDKVRVWFLLIADFSQIEG